MDFISSYIYYYFCFYRNNPIPLGRAWCLVEIMTAATVLPDDKFTIELLHGEKDEFLAVLCEDYKKVMECMTKVDAANATCYVESDRLMIFANLDKTGGPRVVNVRVKDQLRNAFLLEVLEAIEVADRNVVEMEEKGVDTSELLPGWTENYSEKEKKNVSCKSPKY